MDTLYFDDTMSVAVRLGLAHVLQTERLQEDAHTLMVAVPMPLHDFMAPAPCLPGSTPGSASACLTPAWRHSN